VGGEAELADSGGMRRRSNAIHCSSAWRARE
jgi:hypothetical protein